MIKFNDGNYAIYKNIRYKLSSNTFDNKCKGLVRIVSRDKQSLKEGFFTIESNEYLEYNFYCIKDVPKSEITEAYKIETTAIYKKQKYYVDSALTQGEDMVRIYTPPISTVKETELYNEYKKNGFSDGMKFEYGDVLLYKYISVNDPDLQIIEKRTELDISKL